MKAINIVILSGFLGKDVEVRTSKNGKSFCYFSIATDGEWNPTTKTTDSCWVDCEAWDSVADYFGKYGKRGCRVEIEGKLKQCTRVMNDKKYQTYVVKVNTNGSHIIPKNNSGNSNDFGGTDYGRSYSEPAVEISDDALPF